MALFEKKYCDICGAKIGLLGNRKLDDGNLCKNCAAKLSPFFSDRRHSSVEDIRRQLEYREQNKQAVSAFNCTRVLGGTTKIYLDDQNGRFCVSRASDWRAANPDILNLSQVTGVNTDVREHRQEIYRKDKDGKNVSFNPPKYAYTYEFETSIQVNSPWFNEIEFELSTVRPNTRLSTAYHELERQAAEIRQALMPQSFYGQNQFQQGYAQRQAQYPQGYNQAYNQPYQQPYQPQYNQQQYQQPVQQYQQPVQAQYSQQACQQPQYQQQTQQANMQVAAGAGGMAAATQSAQWQCPICGMPGNTGNFCEGCGSRRP